MLFFISARRGGITAPAHEIKEIEIDMSANDRRPHLSLITSIDTPSIRGPERHTLCPECRHLAESDERRTILAFQLSGSHIGSAITYVEGIVTVSLTADRIEHTIDAVRVTDDDSPESPVIIHRLSDVIVPFFTEVDDPGDPDRITHRHLVDTDDRPAA